MPRVVAVHRSEVHGFSKQPTGSIELVAGLGVLGDAHLGAQVQHRSRVRADPTQPNLRQVHLVASELLDDAVAAGLDVSPGGLGENITTVGIDLIGLPTGATLRIGTAIIALTGLRNPCSQIEAFRPGLLQFVQPMRAGVMGVVIHGGTITGGDEIEVGLPPGTPIPMIRV